MGRDRLGKNGSFGIVHVDEQDRVIAGDPSTPQATFLGSPRHNRLRRRPQRRIREEERREEALNGRQESGV
jgi:hypothetical protein